MGKVMVFERTAGFDAGAEWYSRGGVITVRNGVEIANGAPERPAGTTHNWLHNANGINTFKFKELRNE